MIQISLHGEKMLNRNIYAPYQTNCQNNNWPGPSIVDLIDAHRGVQKVLEMSKSLQTQKFH